MIILRPSVRMQNIKLSLGKRKLVKVKKGQLLVVNSNYAEEL